MRITHARFERFDAYFFFLLLFLTRIAVPIESSSQHARARAREDESGRYEFGRRARERIMDHLTVHSFSSCSSVSLQVRLSLVPLGPGRSDENQSTAINLMLLRPHYPMVSSGTVFREGENPITQGLPPITRRYGAR